jgi:DNA-binding transcriptional MerR regulator
MALKTPRAVIAAFSEEQVGRLTGISQRQLRYWALDNFFVPSLLSTKNDDLPPLKMYSFRDLVCLKVINALRNDAKIPLKDLRGVRLCKFFSVNSERAIFRSL